MTIDCYDARDRLVQFELPDNGKLTPQFRWVLTNGHCHSFAQALQRLTSWQMVGRIKQGKVEHVFCQMPDGRLVDAELTVKRQGERLNAWRGLRFRFLPPNFHFSAEDGWLSSIENVLIPFAQTRLEELKRESGEEFHFSEYPFWQWGNDAQERGSTR
jgi:hypothetical protein